MKIGEPWSRPRYQGFPYNKDPNKVRVDPDRRDSLKKKDPNKVPLISEAHKMQKAQKAVARCI